MKKTPLVMSVILIFLGIGLMLIPQTPPKLECVSREPVKTTTDSGLEVAEIPQISGFTDPTQDNCDTTLESYEEYRDFQSKPKITRIAGLVSVLCGFVVAIYGAVTRKR